MEYGMASEIEKHLSKRRRKMVEINRERERVKELFRKRFKKLLYTARELALRESKAEPHSKYYAKRALKFCRGSCNGWKWQCFFNLGCMETALKRGGESKRRRKMVKINSNRERAKELFNTSSKLIESAQLEIDTARELASRESNPKLSNRERERLKELYNTSSKLIESAQLEIDTAEELVSKRERAEEEKDGRNQ